LTPEAAALPGFRWAREGIGRRHQLGGAPERIQAIAYPTCGSCGKTMTFYGQLDSLNDEYCIADVGLVYVFICFDCYEAEAVIDSY
jgi:hypothetical protein